MGNEEREREQNERLQALFDATAVEPSREQLDRLARVAAQVPEAAGRGWLASRLTGWRGALLGGLAVAAAAVVVVLWMRQPARQPGAPAAAVESARPETSAAPPTSAEAPPDERPQAIATLDEGLIEVAEHMLGEDPLSSLDQGPDSSPLLALDLLYGPGEAAVANPEAWSELYALLLEDS